MSDSIEILELENKMLRARNERLEAEQHLQALHDENVRLGLYEQPTVNQFNPDYDGVAMMYEEMKVMAKRIEELEALAKQEQGEPVTNDPLPRACNLAGVDYQTFLKIKAYMPVYTTPQQRKPLTWERVIAIGLMCANDRSRLPFEVKVARAIEYAHGIKE